MKHLLIPMVLFFALCALSCKQGTVQKKKAQEEMASPVQTKLDNPPKEETQPFHQEMVKNCNQTFDGFFDRFGRDSVFQKDRVRYPMKWLYHAEANYHELTTEIIDSKINFRYFNFTKDKNAINRKRGAFQVKRINYTDSITYQRVGFDTGLLISFKFELIDGCWYLVSIIDQST